MSDRDGSFPFGIRRPSYRDTGLSPCFWNPSNSNRRKVPTRFWALTNSDRSGPYIWGIPNGRVSPFRRENPPHPKSSNLFGNKRDRTGRKDRDGAIRHSLESLLKKQSSNAEIESDIAVCSGSIWIKSSRHPKNTRFRPAAVTGPRGDRSRTAGETCTGGATRVDESRSSKFCSRESEPPSQHSCVQTDRSFVYS